MTESFITGAFQKMGEYPKNVKLMRNKNTGETAGYAFVDFYDPVSIMHKLNGKFIPGTNPVSYHLYYPFVFLILLLFIELICIMNLEKIKNN